ncbi:MAG: hypothetical protein KC491_01330 [Dehalococcoidia bacterium]|nr:hypothetical protein [Dehalococcoidia bacterium]
MFSLNKAAAGFTFATLAAAVIARGGESDFLSRYEGEANADDHSIRATLVREGECVYLELVDGSRTFPVFPTRSAEFNQETNVLTVEGQGTRVGEEVHLLGSGGPLAQYPDIRWAHRPDISCDTDEIWFVGLQDPPQPKLFACTYPGKEQIGDR